MTSPPAGRREIWAWAMYDFANSAFATVILAAVFPVFFAKVIVTDSGGASIWGYVVSASMIIVACMAPFVGALTDTSASKKRYLLVFWVIGCAATCCLALVEAGHWALAAGIFVVSNICFAGGNALYNAFLPEIAPREKMDRISAFGWGLGYLGGGLCLAIGFVMIQKWNAIRETLVLAGAWWLVFSIPMFLWVRERATPVVVQGSRLRHAVGKVFSTFRRIRDFKELAKFLVAFLLFNDGLETVIAMAAVFGEELLKMDAGELSGCFLMIQGVALLGAWAFAWLAERLGSKRALIISLLIWCAVVIGAYLIQTKTHYWIIAAAAGTVIGGTQAIARSVMGKFTPPKLTGEFFGFFAIGGKAASALGPFLFAWMTQATGSVRGGVLSIIVFFVAGLAILVTVDEKKGIAQAEAA